MSDKGYLNRKREEQLAKILDASVDFDQILKDKKKLFGVINLGSVLERYDRKLFRILISVVDDTLNKNADPEKAAAFEKAIQLLENEDIQGFGNYIADIMERKIDIPYVDNDREIFIFVLGLFNAIIRKAVKKIDLLIAEANAEA